MLPGNATRACVESRLKAHGVALFMKGGRHAPAYGCSAAARTAPPALPQARIFEAEGFGAIIPSEGAGLALTCQHDIPSPGVAGHRAARGFIQVHDMQIGMETWAVGGA